MQLNEDHCGNSLLDFHPGASGDDDQTVHQRPGCHLWTGTVGQSTIGKSQQKAMAIILMMTMKIKTTNLAKGEARIVSTTF